MTVKLNHADHPLRLLAAAAVGRPVAITYLMQDHASSYSDGERIFLPGREDLATRRLEVMVQGALICGDSLSPRRMQSLLGRSELAERYLVLEVERCCRAIASRLPSQLFVQLERYSTGFFPGNADASFEIAQGRRHLPAPPVWFGVLRPWRVLSRSLQAGAQPLTEQTLAQLEASLTMMTEDSEEEEKKLKRASFWKLFTSPLARDTMMSRFLRDILNMRSSPSSDRADNGSASSQMVAGRAARRVRDLAMAIGSEMDIPNSSAFVHVDAGAHRYHEWDCEKRRYRPNWVSVEETDPHADEPQFDSGILNGSNLPFQRALGGLYQGFQRHRDQPQGDDLGLDRMVRFTVDLQSGHSGDPRIYAASLRTRRDLGVLILLDASSSTLERNVDGQHVFDLQAQAAWHLCRALGALGDRVAMHGFNSWGRRLVRFQKLKAFDEPIGTVLESRLRHLAIAGYTRCGAAIRHGTVQLEQHAGTPYKLLLLISDGYPYDDQYEGEYASEDTRKAIEEAGARGIACVCLSVGSDVDRARLEQVYGASNYLACHKVEQMVPRLHRLVESAIASAMRTAV
jgi:nitric oxide reductase NorD protein